MPSPPYNPRSALISSSETITALLSHRLALQRVQEALATGLSVVVDDTNCFRFLRDAYRAVAVRLDVQSLLLYLDLPMDTLLARASVDHPARPPVARDVLLDLIGKFEAPAPKEQAIRVPPGFVPATWVAQNLGGPDSPGSRISIRSDPDNL